MGLKTTISGISYAANHQAAARQAGQNVVSLHDQALLQTIELTKTLNVLLATMQTGDPNIATIQAQLTALA